MDREREREVLLYKFNNKCDYVNRKKNKKQNLIKVTSKWIFERENETFYQSNLN
jgi:hypothetical protein